MYTPFGFPVIKSFNCLPPVVCQIYQFRPCHALFLVFTLQVVGNVPQFVRPTPLDRNIRIYYFNSTVQPLAAIDTDELAVVPRRSSLSLMSDNGCQPTSISFMKSCRDMGIKQAFTSYNNPKGNADTERFFRTMKEELLWLRDWVNPMELMDEIGE